MQNSSNEALVRSFQLAFLLQSIAFNEGGPLPPSRRRSLFTLATSMILFSSKAFNILPIADCAKAALTEITVDPFLRLVDDRKLQAVNTGLNQPANTLSQIQLPSEQHRETLASEIVKSLGHLSEPELSSIRARLLREFLPDDVCPLGSQFPTDAPHKVYQASAEENEFIIKEVNILAPPSKFYLSMLGTQVLETAYQFGRSPVCTGPNMSYKEITRHCETLVTGKQQKMSHLLSAQLRQDNMTNQTGPIVEQTGNTNLFKQPMGTLPMPCATEYHNHPPFFSLPASTPYDNFLKAASCWSYKSIQLNS
ncbi:hypothetical protein GOBAR_AA19624 [Gossypium barbadense]|uniref:Uncharacterized protein n=1 Tax=Gossypium barbadense TaxID=3634 RepID=A0A2P5XCI3_GOSBA|nr:hypothetical protein GOBAR_AA19624 [Gossypium barbadense]